MIDAVKVFTDAVYSLGNIETTSIDCNSNNDWKHGYSLINRIRTVLITVKITQQRFTKSFIAGRTQWSHRCD